MFCSEAVIKVCKLYENFSQYGKIMFVIIVFQDEKIAEIKCKMNIRALIPSVKDLLKLL